MSWKGYETFKVCTSHKEYEKWKKQKNKKLNLPTLEQAISISHKYKDDELIYTEKSIYRAATLKRMSKNN